MKFNKLSKIFGLIFGISLFVVAYICLPIGIALAFAKKGDFAIMIYVFAGLAIATIVGACLTKKSILTTRIIFSISTAVLVATIIYLIAVGLFVESTTMLLLFIADAALGICSTVFAFLAKSNKAEITNP